MKEVVRVSPIEKILYRNASRRFRASIFIRYHDGIEVPNKGPRSLIISNDRVKNSPKVSPSNITS